MGFALLSRHFEKSRVPVALPKYLPNDWKGGFHLVGDSVDSFQSSR